MRKSHLRGRGISRAARGTKSAFIMAAAVASFASIRTVVATTATWLDTDANGNWSDANNWSTNPTVPGDDSGGTTNTDEAVFNSSPVSNVVNLDTANWNIQNILFDTATATNFAIGATANTGNSLLLTNGGNITVSSTVTSANNDVINAPVVLEGSSYSLVDDAPNVVSGTATLSTGLQVSGNITVGVTGTTSLILDGTSETAANGASSNAAIINDISNGSATTLNLVKQGAGTWELRTTDTNTYTGSTTINGGALRVTTAGALPATTDVIVNGPTSLLRLSGPTGIVTLQTIHSLTLENGQNSIQAVQSSSSLDGINITNNSGPGWTWDASTNTATVTTKLQLNFTSTINGTDGFVLINSATTPLQKIGSDTINLGPANRIFNVPHGGQSLSSNGNSTDLEIDGVVTSTGGGFTKTGAGILKLENGVNTFTGPIEIQQGQFKLVGGSTPDSLIGTNPLLVDGGTLNINGANAAFGAATFTSGATLSSTANLSAAINAPSFAFSVSSGNTFTMANEMGDDGSPSAVVSNGTGTVTLSNASTYSGGTTISAGTFIINNSATIGGSATGTGNVTLNGGILASGAVGSISGNVLAGSAAHTIAPGGVGSVGTLTIGGLTSSTLTTLSFALGTGSGTITNGSQLILGSGTVSIASGTAMTFTGTPVAGNDYQLIGDTSSGAVVGAINLANFKLPAAPAGLGYSLADNSGFIDLDVISSGPSNLTWNDASADNLWNTTSSNWNNGSSTTTYSNGSGVTFNDNNGGHYNVTLSSSVTPASVTVNNSSGNYAISGTGSITGTTALTKSGSGNLTLSTANSYTGGTTVNQGTLVVGVNGALPAAGAVAISNGTVQLGVSTGAATVTSLAITGNGTFDVNNDHLFINYGGGTDPITSIAALLKTGYNGGHWNGAGGIVSSAAAVTPGYGLGYADSADTGNPASLASGNIEIKYTLLGDTNLDGVVNAVDFGILAANFNKGVSRWDQGDFNYDNVVSAIDFGELAANFNKGATGTSIGLPAYEDPAILAFAQANGLLADVPEPASVGLLAVETLGLMARRRRKA